MKNFLYYSIMALTVMGLSASLLSCEEKSEIEAQIEAIAVEFDIVRFDEAFASASPADLPKLKAQFPDFFPEQYPDSIWVAKLGDTLQDQLEEQVQQEFCSSEVIEEPLYSLFQHISYYFPSFQAPTVVTTTSDVDYRNPVILADNLLIIALDTYLGADHLFYVDIPQFLSKNMKPSQLVQDVASTYARRYIARPSQRNLLAQMVYFGKELYLKDLWLPKTPEAERIGYTSEELNWANDNEEEMWRYFVENEILYSTDAKLPSRFISPAPFSKFFLEIDNESPGMVGRYLGWKIVRSYMEHNGATLQQLLATSAEEIFNNSKYKPTR